MKLPVGVLILDLIGTLLVVLGVVEWFIKPGMVVPQAWQFPFYAQLSIALGVAAMLPMVFFIMQWVAQQGRDS